MKVEGWLANTLRLGQSLQCRGIIGTVCSPCTGQPTKLTEIQQQAVVGWVVEGSTDGEPDWTHESLQQTIEKEFGVSFSLEGIRRLLTRHGLR